MCGISGIFSTQTISQATIKHMVGKQAHRGPDAQGIFISKDEKTALGHNRLSVIDLSASANQPMHSHDGRYVIVFNGEIYNFKEIRQQLSQRNAAIRFETQSDTETILHAFEQWGQDMVQWLDGMFALAIFDQQLNKLFLCRDRVGKKPLFYFNDGTHFVFASEIKSLLAHPVVMDKKRVSAAAISCFLHLGYIPEPHTIFSEVHKFPSGSWALIDRSLTVVPQKFWTIEQEVSADRIENTSSSQQQLKTILERAVQKRLISDVPLGTFLSGGTDSSLVTAIASHQVSNPLKTFSIGFAESKFNESQYAKAVARQLKTDHHEYILSEKEGVDLLHSYIAHFDEPFADTSAIPTMLVSKLARKEVSVALTGDGGDELFQGYGAYDWVNRLNNPLWKMAKLPVRVLLSATGNSRLERVSRLLGDHSKNLYSHIFSQEQYFFSQQEVRDELLTGSNGFYKFEYEPSAQERTLTPGERQALFDFRYYLKDDLLVKVDRASMYYALECRCPLLDKDVISFACSLDVSAKKKEGTSKWILKKILAEYISEDLVYRKKWGFSIPLSRWLKGDLRYLLDEYLSQAQVEETGLFNYQLVTKLKHDFLVGKDYLFNRLWVLIIIHKWLKDNG